MVPVALLKALTRVTRDQGDPGPGTRLRHSARAGHKQWWSLSKKSQENSQRYESSESIAVFAKLFLSIGETLCLLFTFSLN